jgi:putative nucleotidyltransferase with HDIG domain
MIASSPPILITSCLITPGLPRLPVRSPALSTIAEFTAARLLCSVGDRWLHTVGVARRAAEAAEQLGLHADVLVAAAWLHDIGYARVASVTGFHPLDGAHYLAGELWPMRIAGLVAHHSGARFVAAARGLEKQLAAYPDEGGLMRDALTYADQTVGPAGQCVTVWQRRADMLRRHGPGSAYARVDHIRGPHLRAAVARVERALAQTGSAAPASPDPAATPRLTGRTDSGSRAGLRRAGLHRV